MFKPLGLLLASRCPDEQCHRPYCFFAHGQASSSAGSSRPPSKVGAAVPKRKQPSDGAGGQDEGVKKARPVTGSSRSASQVISPPRNSLAKQASSTPRSNFQSTGAETGSIRAGREASRPIVGDGTAAAATARTSAAPSVARPPVPAPVPQSTGAPSISREAKDLRSSKQPYADRQKALQTLFTQYGKLYSAISATHPDLAAQSSKQEELDISASSTDLSAYKRAIHHAAVSVSRRKPPDTADHPSVGTVRQSREATTKAEKAAAGRLTQERIQRYLLPAADFGTWRYPDIADSALTAPETVEPDAEGSEQKCDRCASIFTVSAENLSQRKGECVYHHGRIQPDKVEGKRKWLYTCCRAERGTKGCESGVHVFNEREDDALLARRVEFRSVSNEAGERAGPSAHADVVAMDCEMIYTTAGYSLARTTIVDENGGIILDEQVRQTAKVIDYNTRFSGITEENLAAAVMDIRAVRAAACMFIGPETVIVGHGLENDLRALRLLHDKVIDTAMVFPHEKGPPYRRALRDLVKERLGYFIQQSSSTEGHSSAEDAIATLEVLKSKLREDVAAQGM